MKSLLTKLFDVFGVIRALIAILSVGVAHNFAFMMPMPIEFWSIIDATFLTGVTVHYLFFLSGVLVLSVLTAQMLGVARGAYLGVWVRRLERRHYKRLHPISKRERYFNRVHRKIEGRTAPISGTITWCLPIAIIGYYYAGWLALVSLPALAALFSISVPVLYPTLNFDIQIIDDENAKRDINNAKFWSNFLSDIGALKQLTAFLMSAAILLSGYLGLTRHNYLAKSAAFEFSLSATTEQFKFIGTNAHGYVVFDSDNHSYFLVSYGDTKALRSIQ